MCFQIIILALALTLSSGICGHSSGHQSVLNASLADNVNAQFWKTDLHSPNRTLTSTMEVELSEMHRLTSPNNNNGNDSKFNASLNALEYNGTKESASEDGFERFLLIKSYLDPTIMCIIFFFGGVSNVTLLVMLVRHKELRSPSNACIFTMAIGDLMSVIFNVPLFYALLISKSWTVGVALCKLLWFFSDFSVGLSIFAVTMLSVQRYRGVVYTGIYLRNSPFTLKLRLVSACNILLIWVLSFSFAVRTAITSDVTNETCSSAAGSYGPEFSKNIALLNFFVFCIIPLCVIAVFYGLTARHLIASARDIPGEESVNKHRLMQVRKKGARIVLALTGVFFISYVPWYLWQVLFFWGNFSSDYKTVTYTYTFLYYFFFGNLCFNPVALYCVSSAFRKYFNQYLFCGRKVKVDELLKTSVKTKSSLLSSSTNTRVQ